MFWQIILQVVLIVLNAVFSCAEAAIISINDSRLDKLAAGGDKRALRLKKLTGKPTGFLSSIQTAVTLTGFFSAAFAAVNFSGRLTDVLLKAGVPMTEKALNVISAVVITFVMSCVMLIFGELVPKRAAAKNAEKLGLAFSGMASFISKLFAPLVFVVNAAANGILKIMQIDTENQGETVTEEEILMMSDAGAENGTIDEDENRIIKNIFAFDDMTVEQICTHRTDVSVLWSGDTSEVWEETIHRTRHSVFPVCGESVDNVIGVLDAKDYFRLDDKSKESVMENAVHEPYFVHENMKADRLFAQMKKNNADHFAVVVDEYGGMSGIITVTDLVEQLVGDFDDDEFDEPAAKFEQLSENVWSVPGIMMLSEIAEELETELPADKYETFGGYVIARLGEIPKDGTQTHIECDGLHIDVVEVKHHRIEKCCVSKIGLQTESRETNTEINF